MAEKPEQDPFEELKILFTEAAARAYEAWQEARRRSEEAAQTNEVFRAGDVRFGCCGCPHEGCAVCLEHRRAVR